MWLARPQSTLAPGMTLLTPHTCLQSRCNAEAGGVGNVVAEVLTCVILLLERQVSNLVGFWLACDIWCAS